MNYIHLLSCILTFCYCSVINASGEESKSSHQTVENSAVSLNEFTGELHEEIALKESVQQFFGINRLEHVDDNERELEYVLELVWTKNDPFLSFAALMDQIGIRGNRRYKVLFRPLVMHLVKAYREFDAKTQQQYQEYLRKKYNVSVERLLADRCMEKGHYDLVFDLFGEDKILLRNLFSKFNDRKAIIEFFRANPLYARQYLAALLPRENEDSWDSLELQSSNWIAECIINDLPEEYYEGLFAPNSRSFILLLTSFLFLSANENQTDHELIHAKIEKLLDNTSGNVLMLEDLKMINYIRYGSSDLSTNNFDDISEKFINFYSLAALLANKKDLFDLFRERATLDLIVTGIEDLHAESFEAKNFKFIFEMIRDNLYENFTFIRLLVVEFVIKFYAVTHLALEDETLSFEFQVAESLLQFDFPPVIQITTKGDRSFILNIFLHMKVFNERSLQSLLPDVIKYYQMSNPEMRFGISYEFLEVISGLPELLMLLVDNHLGFNIQKDADFFGKYLNLPNFRLTSELINFDDSNMLVVLPKLNSKDHLSKIDWIFRRRHQSLSVPSAFIHYESRLVANKNPKLIYLEWRLVFDYWINGPGKRGIKLIKTPEIIEMLRSEYPEATAWI